MQVEVTFLKDFAGKTKGDTMKIDSMVANRLISQKAAKLFEKKQEINKKK